MAKRKIKEKAFIYKQTPFGESSVIFNAFGENLGLFALIAKGIRKDAKNPGLELLQEYELSLYEPTEDGLYLLLEGSKLTEVNRSFRADTMAAGFAAFELISQLLLEGNESQLYYRFVKDYLRYLDKINTNHIAIFWRFWMRVFNLMGVDIALQYCHACKSPMEKAYAIELSHAALYCRSCFDSRRQHTELQVLSPNAAKLLKILPNIGNVIGDISIARAEAMEINELFMAHYQIHLHYKPLLKSLQVLMQFYH